MQPEFTVVQGKVDEQVLHALKDHFGCGSVVVNRKDATSTRMMFRVKNIEQCHKIIVPFFEKHKLITKKRVEFERFRTIVRLMHEGYHTKSLKNFLEVIELGEKLRERASSSNQSKRGKVNAQIAELRKKLAMYESEGFLHETNPLPEAEESGAFHMPEAEESSAFHTTDFQTNL